MKQPRFVKALFSRLKHVHKFEYPWESYRRCVKKRCSVKQFYWECRREWFTNAPHELFYRFGRSLRQKDKYETGHTEVAERQFKRERPWWVHPSDWAGDA